MIGFNYNDGGRTAAGFKGKCQDCAVRAIAIATQIPYKQVYSDINDIIKELNDRGKLDWHKSIRCGVPKIVSKQYLKKLGWKWIPTMKIGQGCKTHLNEDELPEGRIIVSVSKHLTAVIDKVINDTYDCSRDGNRCVYGYFVKED